MRNGKFQVVRDSIKPSVWFHALPLELSESSLADLIAPPFGVETENAGFGIESDHYS